MHYIVLAALLFACVLADVQPQYYSFSETIGTGSGDSYRLVGNGRITAVRVWERYSNNINGFQFRYGFIWSPVAGISSGTVQEIELDEDEAVIQISGKYSHHLMSVVFITNKGRTLQVGQPSGRSFNLYRGHPLAELRFISGRFQQYYYNSGITSLQVHWGIAYSNSTALN